MHLNLKRVASTALAVVMSLGLSVTAFAEGNGGTQTLTVTGETLGNKTVYAVKMFDARATTADEGESYSFDSYELATEWEGFFQTELSSKKTGSELSEEAVTYVSGLKDEDNLVDFAHEAQKYVRDNEESFEVLSATAENGTATFTNLAAGYYLVYPEGGSYTEEERGSGVVSPARGSDAMLVNVPRGGNAVLKIKSTFPTVDKKVDTDGDGEESNPAADNGSAQVGDIVTFTLTSQVPDMSDYNSYVFQFTDKLPEGLTLVNKDNDTAITQNTEFTVDDITLTINGSMVKAENVTVTLTDGSGADNGKKILTVKIDNLKANDLLEGQTVVAGQDIVLSYKAMINEKAVTTDPVTNEASVQYSNDPNGTGLGTSTPDESKVYTYDIDVNKWAEDAGGKDDSLAGAKFVLSTSETLTGGEEDPRVIKLVGSAQSYRVAEPNEERAVTSFTTTADGDIKISGLEAGTYYLHEITAPAGYNKLKAPVKIEIVVTEDNYANATIKVDGDEIAGNGTTVDVENKKGIELPETGSIGTIGLTAAGVAIVLLGVFAPRKKKKGTQE